MTNVEISSVSTDISPDTSSDISTDTVTLSADVRKTARLGQLALARESAKNKKRKDRDSMENMQNKLDKLTSLLETPKQTATVQEPEASTPPPTHEEDVPEPKRVRITREEEDTEDDVPSPEGWTTSAIRGTVLLVLTGASWWMQHGFRKQTPKTRPILVKKTTSAPQDLLPIKQPNFLSKMPVKRSVGTSGFMM